MREYSRGLRWRGPLAWLLTFAAVAPAPARAATWPPFVPEQVAASGTGYTEFSTAPRLAIDRTSGALHLAWMIGSTVWRAWETGDGWQAEAVGTGLELLDWGVGRSGRPAALCVQPGGTVVVLRPTTGDWHADTVLTDPGPFLGALALDAADEPVAALATNPAAGLLAHLWLARRDSGLWTVVELDTSMYGMGRPSLALDATGRARIACTDGPRANGGRVALRYHEAAGAVGPVVASTADSGWIRDPSLALDPASGEPRVAYTRGWSGGGGYAARIAGQWHVGALPFFGSYMSLSIAPDGSATVAGTHTQPIEPRLASEPTFGCGYVAETGVVLVAQSLTGVDGAGFAITAAIGPGWTSGSGPRSVLALGLGHARVALGSCAARPEIWLARQDGSVDAPIGRLDGTVRLLLAPNPVRSDGPFTVAFSLAQRARVTLAVYDVVGRAALTRDLGVRDAGRYQEALPPPAVTGIYWLALRADGATLARVPLVVVR